MLPSIIPGVPPIGVLIKASYCAADIPETGEAAVAAVETSGSTLAAVPVQPF